MFRRFHRSGQGDTIIEVLIAIAVVASVLGITYSIMNRNILIMRDNQERTEATKQAQGQIEALKTLWGTNAGRLQLTAIGDNGFCISPTGTILPLGGGAPNATASADGDFSGYRLSNPPESSCRFKGLYHVGLRRETISAGNVRYKVFVRWDRISRGGRNESIIAYRLE